MENMLETITCFFNFRSPYAYLGVRKALEKNLKFKFIPVCYLPKELLKFLEDAAENDDRPKPTNALHTNHGFQMIVLIDDIGDTSKL